MKNTVRQLGLLTFLLLFSIGHSTLLNAQTDDQEVSYVKVEVKGLACPFCAFGLEKKLKETEGVETINIDVEEGLTYLSVLNSKKPTKETLEKIVIDAGFTVSSIVFSEKPFTLKDVN